MQVRQIQQDGLLRAQPPIEPFARPPKGMILSEGAGAVVLARDGALAIERIHPGGNFARQREAVRQLDTICREIKGAAAADVLIASANGTFVDEAERVVGDLSTATVLVVVVALRLAITGIADRPLMRSRVVRYRSPMPANESRLGK